MTDFFPCILTFHDYGIDLPDDAYRAIQAAEAVAHQSRWEEIVTADQFGPYVEGGAVFSFYPRPGAINYGTYISALEGMGNNFVYEGLGFEWRVDVRKEGGGPPAAGPLQNGNETLGWATLRRAEQGSGSGSGNGNGNGATAVQRRGVSEGNERVRM